MKQAYFNGDPNVPLAKFPTYTAGELPDPLGAAGAMQRFTARGQRWKTSQGWTPEIAIALGYGGSTVKPEPSTLKPQIELFAAASNYHFSIVVSNRGEATMWDVYILRKGGNWTKADSATGKSADVFVTPTTPGDPQQLQVRVQLRKSNADYGLVSDPAYVTINP